MRASWCAHVCIGFKRGSIVISFHRPFADLVDYHLVVRLCLIVLVVLVLTRVGLQRHIRVHPDTLIASWKHVMFACAILETI